MTFIKTECERKGRECLTKEEINLFRVCFSVQPQRAPGGRAAAAACGLSGERGGRAAQGHTAGQARRHEVIWSDLSAQPDSSLPVAQVCVYTVLEYLP